MKARVGAGLAAGGQKEYHPLQESILRQLLRRQSCFRYTKRMSLSHKASSRRADSRGPTPRNDAGRRFFADETCNHHAAACSSLPGRCLRARRTRPPPQQRPLGVTEACLFTKQLVQDRLLQWISLFLPSVRTHSTKPARFRIPQVWLNRAFVIVRANCQLWSIMARGTYPNLACVRSHQACR